MTAPFPLLKPSLLAGICLTAMSFPTLAHTTQVSGNIAGTWHIEPNHSPKAGEPSQVWIALTRAGGELVPLDQCDCHLKIYEASPSGSTAPVLEPRLQPITSEQYQAIPGAEVVFPQVGLYELTLSGTPKVGAEFQPFELRYTVTVAAGVSSPQPSSMNQSSLPNVKPSENTTAFPVGWIVGGGVAIALIAATLTWITKRNQSSRSGTSQ